jgi:hypothetical protein
VRLLHCRDSLRAPLPARKLTSASVRADLVVRPLPTTTSPRSLASRLSLWRAGCQAAILCQVLACILVQCRPRFAAWQSRAERCPTFASGDRPESQTRQKACRCVAV